MMFREKTVVVTGAGRGIGRALAIGFAEQGARVLVHYGHARSGAEEVVGLIRERGGSAQMAQADLREVGAVRDLIAQAHTQLGKIDVWINNAGASANSREAVGMSEVEIFERVMAVDVMGSWLCAREVALYMNDGGCILMIGWDAALSGAKGLPGQLYAMSKGAVISLTRCLALEYAPRLRVNCIAPGYVENEWLQSLSEKVRQRLQQANPLQRLGTPEDILGTALFLASPAAAFITGQVILVNGGEVMR
jgi:NAD(P)-dependent dehydrogenase (short-subunit alcohol dehydrogenase family)